VRVAFVDDGTVEVDLHSGKRSLSRMRTRAPNN
jgi:hypothetical protein